jgi:uncharacterized surface protein with fasciclin (FAS1) repeats
LLCVRRNPRDGRRALLWGENVAASGSAELEVRRTRHHCNLKGSPPMIALRVAALVSLSLFATAPAQARNVVEVAQSTGQFNTLIAAAKAAGIAGALTAPGKKTVFAPTDAAFARLPKGTVANLLKPQNKDKLKAILTYHVVGGSTIRARDIKTGTTNVGTLNGQDVRVRKNGHGVSVNGVSVSQADVKADNGIIHVIGKVLLPK